MEQLILALQSIVESPILPYTGIAILVFVLLKTKDVKTLRIGNWISFEGRTPDGQTVPPAITNSRDVKQYHMILQYAVYSPFGILADIRYRVRRNGWEKRSDWIQYKKDAIQIHRDNLTHILDLHYPDECKIGRIELFEANEALRKKVIDRYERMYDSMYDIFLEAHKEAKELKCHLKKDYDPPLTLVEALDIAMQAWDIERLQARESCMNEAERSLREIMQMYYSHYLSLYAQATTEKKKG